MGKSCEIWEILRWCNLESFDEVFLPRIIGSPKIQ